MKTHEELVKQAKDFISKHKTGKAIELLEKADLPKLEMHIINLSSRFSKLSKDMQLNILDNDTTERTLNKINVDLFELLNTIEKGGAIEEVKAAPVKVEEVAPSIQTPPQNNSDTKALKKSLEKTLPTSSIASKSNSKMYIILAAGLLLLAAGAFWFYNQSKKTAAAEDLQKQKQKQEQAQAEEDAKNKESEKTKKIADFNKVKKEAFVGNDFRGGIIFYVEEDEEDEELRGLIAARGDAHPTKISWLGNNKSPVKAGAFKDGLFDGKGNTTLIYEKFKDDKVLFPAKLCVDYAVSDGENKYDDWYLPSEDELDKLYDYSNRDESKLEGSFTNDYYWSSTEVNTANVYYRSFYKGNGRSYTKLGNNKGKVRPIRKFVIKIIKE